MTEKVKITQRQLDLIKRGTTKATLLEGHAKGGYRNKEYDELLEIPLADFARVLYEPYSYEVLPEYEVGDPVKYQNHFGNWIFGTIDKFVNESAYCRDWSDGVSGGIPVAKIERQAPEEIKAEQERRQWAKIGREPGEFQDGDGGRHAVSGNSTRSKHVLHTWYQRGQLKGFFPAESFIEFGGNECETCQGEGEVFQESRAGKHATANMGWVECPDCERGATDA